MPRHPTIAPTLLLLALLCPAWSADTSTTETSTADGTPVGNVPANSKTTFSAQTPSTGQVEDDINKYASDIKALEAKNAPDAGDGMTTLYQSVMNENAAEMVIKNRALDQSGTTRFKGRTFDLGVGSLTVGGQVSDIDTIDSYPQIPEYVHFITSEKNQLGALDTKMKKAASFLNKHTCGGFDWAAQFGFMFKVSALKEYLTNLGEGVIAAAPMALLGAFSPQLAEIVKHLKLMSGMDLSATKADCQAIQAAMTSGLQKSMWGDNYTQCLAQHKDDGVSAATKQCQDLVGAVSVSMPDGGKTNPITATDSGTGWLTGAYSASQSWLNTVYPADPNATSASALTKAQGTPGQTGQENSDTSALKNAQTNNTTQAYLNSDKTSVAKDLADTLFGSVKIQGTGALELGNKSYQLFSLKMKAHSAQLYSTIVDNLQQHYDLIMNPDTDGSELSESYQNLKICTYRARGAGTNVPPWRDPMMPDDSKHLLSPKDLEEDIDDHTMDSAAYLLHYALLFRNNAPVWADAEKKYGITKFVVSLATFECYLHLYRQLLEKKKSVDMIKRSGSPSGGDFNDLMTKATEQFDPAMTTMGNDLLQKQHEVLQHLAMINKFVVPRPVHFYDDEPGPGTSPPPEDIKMAH